MLNPNGEIYPSTCACVFSAPFLSAHCKMSFEDLLHLSCTKLCSLSSNFSYTLGTAISSVGLTSRSVSCNKFLSRILLGANVTYRGRNDTNCLEKSAICAVICDNGRNDTIFTGFSISIRSEASVYFKLL